MNKYIWSFSIALLGSAGVQSLSAQSTMTAIHLAQTEEYQGSARYQSLGGAMGAVGADYSSVRQNPAGIALYRSSAKMSLTLGHNRLSFNPRWQGESLTKEVNRNILDNFSYISSLGFEGADWGFSGGFSIHNGGRFYNELDAHTTNTDGRSGSLADYAAIRINQEQDPRNLINDYDFRKRDAYKLGIPWIGVLGYNTGWVATKTPSTGGRYESNFVYTKDGQTVKANPLDAGLLIKETGGIREYEASFGARYQNWLFMGVNLTFSSLEYNLITSYQESFGSGDGLLLNNKMSISGTGGRVGLGLIVEPVSGLRLGASMYTPTAYSLKYDHSTFAQGTHNAEELKDQTPDGNAGVFRLYTPWRFGLSGAYVLGHRAILSADRGLSLAQ